MNIWAVWNKAGTSGIASQRMLLCAKRSGGTNSSSSQGPQYQDQTTPGAKDEQIKGEGPPGGGRLPPEQKSSGESEGQKQGFSLQPIPSGQERQRAQASH